MKSLIVYSSLTGNTKAVAQAIASVMPEPCELVSVDQAPSDLSSYDFIAIGYWVDRGMPNKSCIKFMETVKGKKVGLFGTLGAYPDSEHGRNCQEKAASFMEGNQILGQFLCQGKVDPKVIEMMSKMAKKHHPMTQERKARIEEAKKHPNEEDFENARKAFSAMIENL